MRYKIGTILYLLMIILVHSEAGNCDNSNDLLLVTNEVPPYTILKNDELSGISVDIVKKLSNLAGYSNKIVMLPWKRAMQEAQHLNVLLFPYVRNPYREKQFKWIGPIMTDTFIFTVRSEDKRALNTIDDFKNLEVGVVQGTSAEYRLKKLGFENLQSVGQEKQNAFKIIYGNRIDAWYVPELIFKHTLLSEGINSEKIIIAYKDIDVGMHIAASLSVPDKIVALWQRNFDDLQKSGQYRKIVNKYIVEQSSILGNKQ